MMALLTPFLPWIVAALSALGAAFAVWHTGKKVGQAQATADNAVAQAKATDTRAADAIVKANAANETQTKAVENANTAAKSVAVTDDPNAELLADWSRTDGPGNK